MDENGEDIAEFSDHDEADHARCRHPTFTTYHGQLGFFASDPTRSRRHNTSGHSDMAVDPTSERHPQTATMQISTSHLANTAWEIRKEIRKFFDPMQTTRWMMSAHDCFGGLSAIDMIKAGRVDEVRRVIAQLRDGSFA